MAKYQKKLGVERELSPYSRANNPRKIDHRTTIGKHLAAFERGLIEHCGGRPSLPVRSLIDQAVSIELQLTLLERKGIETDHDRRCYAAWLNGKRLTLRAIGFEPAKTTRPAEPLLKTEGNLALDPAEAYRAMIENRPLPLGRNAPSRRS
jgi:hypothetical protein